MTTRPWKVFVHDIGPTFTYASPEKAHAKAAGLVPEYARVSVYNSGAELPLRRTLYRFDGPPTEQEFGADGWKDVTTTYKVRRFYRDDDERNGEVVATGLTLEEAQAHCSRDDTRGDGVDGPWFDGYDEEGL